MPEVVRVAVDCGVHQGGLAQIPGNGRGVGGNLGHGLDDDLHVFRPDTTAIESLREFRQQRCRGAAGHQLAGQDLGGRLDPGGGVGRGDGEGLPEQRLGGGAGPVFGDAEFFDFPGVVDLRGVDGPGKHFQAATEFELFVGQQFPECAVPNVPDRGKRRFDGGVRLVDIGESGRAHI